MLSAVKVTQPANPSRIRENDFGTESSPAAARVALDPVSCPVRHVSPNDLQTWPGSCFASHSVNFAEVSKEKIHLLRSGVCLLVLVIAAITWAGYRRSQDLKATMRSVAQTHTVIEDLEVTLSALQDAETGTRDFILTNNKEYLETYHRNFTFFGAKLEQLRNKYTDDPQQQLRVCRLEDLSSKLNELTDKTFAERSKSLEAALRFIKSEDSHGIRQEIRQLIGDLKAHEKSLLADRQQNAYWRNRFNTVSCIFLLLADITCFGWLTVLSLRLNRLQRVIRVCAWTKQINHDGKWITLEEYLEKMLEAPVTHGICAEAAARMMEESANSPVPIDQKPDPEPDPEPLEVRAA